jgi:hypothetical protein
MLLIKDGKWLGKTFKLYKEADIPYQRRRVRYEKYDYPGETFEGFIAGEPNPEGIIAIEPNGDSLNAPYVDDIKWMTTID